MRIREMRETDRPFLNDFLYDAIFVPEGETPPPYEIIYKPELQVYVTDLGRQPDDLILIAEEDGVPVGACWCRIMDDYGHVDDETPSIIISVKNGYRGRGFGTALLSALLSRLKEKGYSQVSLSCQKANRAVHLYQRLGFKAVLDRDDEYIMVIKL